VKLHTSTDRSPGADLFALSPDPLPLERAGTPPARAERACPSLSLQKLGTRAVVAEALASEAENVERAVRLLCKSAGGGDLAAAKALIPWLNQALGMPTERVEHRRPSDLEELQEMDSEQLERLVAQGREQRLQALRVLPRPAGTEG
jgi:hypothetical protein